MTSGMYKLGSANAHKRLGLTAKLGSAVGDAFGKVRSAVPSMGDMFGKVRDAVPAGALGELKDMAKASPGLFSGIAASRMDDVMFRPKAQEQILSALAPGGIGAGIGAVAGGEDNRLQGALMGAGIGALGGVAGYHAGGMGVSAARQKALQDAITEGAEGLGNLDKSMLRRQDAALLKELEESLPYATSLKDQKAMQKNIKLLQRKLKFNKGPGVGASALQTVIPAAAGIGRAQKLDATGRGLGLIIGGAGGATAGGMAANAYGDSVRERNKRMPAFRQYDEDLLPYK